MDTAVYFQTTCGSAESEDNKCVSYSVIENVFLLRTVLSRCSFHLKTTRCSLIISNNHVLGTSPELPTEECPVAVVYERGLEGTGQTAGLQLGELVPGPGHVDSGTVDD